MQNIKPMKYVSGLEISAFVKENMRPDPVANAAIFSILRALKTRNKGDSYYENYLGHWKKRGDLFFDYYHLLWHMGSKLELKNILEIGCRTGISICQLLASMKSLDKISVTLCDVFADQFLSPEIVKMNMKHLGLPTDIVEFKIGKSQEIIPQLQRYYDYILVDGDHSREVAALDLENIVRLCKEGTIVIFDDISPDGCGLIDVWQTFEHKHAGEFAFYSNMDGKGVGVGVKL